MYCKTSCLVIIGRYRATGYAAAYVILDPKDSGCPHSRRRVYFFGLNVARFARWLGLDYYKHTAEIWEKTQNLVNAVIGTAGDFQGKVSTPDLDSFILDERDPKVLEWRSVALQQVHQKAYARRLTETSYELDMGDWIESPSKEKWEKMHQELWDELSCNPITRYRLNTQPMNPWFTQLTERQRDMAAFYMHKNKLFGKMQPSSNVNVLCRHI